MEAEASSFETSEMLATFLASTPLLSQSWSLCSLANRSAPGSFVTDRAGSAGYVAFSGVQTTAGEDIGFSDMVPLEAAGGEGLFQSLRGRGGEGEERVMVQAGMLQIFMGMYHSPQFQTQMLATMQSSRSLIITGHSIGGAIASLTALWLLSHLQSVSSPVQVICITFGSPLVGNRSLSRAVSREQWGGNFIHIVAKHDIVPRLLFAALPPPPAPQYYFVVQLWHLLMRSLHFGDNLVLQLPEKERTGLFLFVVAHAEAAKAKEPSTESFWPFGSYFFCCKEGAICLDNTTAIVNMLHLSLATGSTISSIEDHLKYGENIAKISQQLLMRRSCNEDMESSYEAGLQLALQSSGIASQDATAEPMKNCLKLAKRPGRTPYLNSANLAIGLSKITPYRAEMEWYKVSCDESDDQMGYYDAFKLRGASRKHFRMNMNRIKLGQFWDEVINMLDTNQLPHDFAKRAKWVNASQFYKLLVEPLDIAEYYRTGTHRIKGHYRKHGRERRFEIFDRWWREREVGKEEHSNNRSKFASLTQDSCFWAKVEEAKEWLEDVRRECETRKLELLWESIDDFERYARGLIDSKEVSCDVLAKNSSYSLLMEDLKTLRSLKKQIPSTFSGLRNREVIP